MADVETETKVIDTMTVPNKMLVRDRLFDSISSDESKTTFTADEYFDRIVKGSFDEFVSAVKMVGSSFDRYIICVYMFTSNESVKSTISSMNLTQFSEFTRTTVGPCDLSSDKTLTDWDLFMLLYMLLKDKTTTFYKDFMTMHPSEYVEFVKNFIVTEIKEEYDDNALDYERWRLFMLMFDHKDSTCMMEFTPATLESLLHGVVSKKHINMLLVQLNRK